MIFNKTTTYAIWILTFMQKKGSGYYSANTLHEELDLPYKYVTNLLTSLHKEGLLDHKMGRSGGFCLAKPAKKILLQDISRATNDLPDMCECILGNGECSADNPCALHHHGLELKKNIHNLLTQTTLEELGSMDIQKL